MYLNACFLSPSSSQKSISELITVQHTTREVWLQINAWISYKISTRSLKAFLLFLREKKKGKTNGRKGIIILPQTQASAKQYGLTECSFSEYSPVDIIFVNSWHNIYIVFRVRKVKMRLICSHTFCFYQCHPSMSCLTF